MKSSGVFRFGMKVVLDENWILMNMVWMNVVFDESGV